MVTSCAACMLEEAPDTPAYAFIKEKLYSPHCRLITPTIQFVAVIKQLDKRLNEALKGEYHKEKIVAELSSQVPMEFLEAAHSRESWDKCKATFICILQRYLIVKLHHTLSKQPVTDNRQNKKLLKITHL